MIEGEVGGDTIQTRSRSRKLRLTTHATIADALNLPPSAHMHVIRIATNIDIAVVGEEDKV
jgi:hypothetical protein